MLGTTGSPLRPGRCGDRRYLLSPFRHSARTFGPRDGGHGIAIGPGGGGPSGLGQVVVRHPNPLDEHEGVAEDHEDISPAETAFHTVVKFVTLLFISGTFAVDILNVVELFGRGQNALFVADNGFALAGAFHQLRAFPGLVEVVGHHAINLRHQVNPPERYPERGEEDQHAEQMQGRWIETQHLWLMGLPEKADGGGQYAHGEVLSPLGEVFEVVVGD